MHGQIIFNILFQNADFMIAVPIPLIKHAFKKIFQFYDGLYLMCLPRASFETFGNKWGKRLWKIPSENVIALHGGNNGIKCLFLITHTYFSVMVPINLI